MYGSAHAMSDYSRTKDAGFASQRLKQIIEESIAHHEQVCAHLDQVKEHIKRSRQTADEAWRVLKRASTTLHPKLGEASVPTLWD